MLGRMVVRTMERGFGLRPVPTPLLLAAGLEHGRRFGESSKTREARSVAADAARVRIGSSVVFNRSFRIDRSPTPHRLRNAVRLTLRASYGYKQEVLPM